MGYTKPVRPVKKPVCWTACGQPMRFCLSRCGMPCCKPVKPCKVYKPIQACVFSDFPYPFYAAYSNCPEMPSCYRVEYVPGTQVQRYSTHHVAPAGDLIQVSVRGERIHIVSPYLEASCDRMTGLGGQDRMLLEGDVCVLSRKEGCFPKVVSERVVVCLQDGSYEVNPQTVLVAPGRPVKPANVFGIPYYYGYQVAPATYQVPYVPTPTGN
jgi:hypothetical protein